MYQYFHFFSPAIPKMEDRNHHDHQNNGETPSVRSRWTPKQEQILILESLFENGVVNPPKDETTRIRRLLENYGPVVDANVFYWFQNRRSRSRRRTRQIEAKIEREQLHDYSPNTNSTQNPSSSFVVPSASTGQECYSSLSLGGGSSSMVGAVNDMDDSFAFSGQVSDYSGIEQNSGASSFANYMSPAHIPNTHYQTVFINGVETEVPMGPLDMKRMFGEEDLVLFHSSGVQVSDFAYSSALQHGQSYFLVPRQI